MKIYLFIFLMLLVNQSWAIGNNLCAESLNSTERIVQARQDIILAKYQSLSLKRALARLSQDLAKQEISISLMSVAKKLKSEAMTLNNASKDEYDLFVSRYAFYLEYRFFSSSVGHLSESELWAKINADAFDDINSLQEVQKLGPDVTRNMNMVGVASYEQTSELLAHGMFVNGTVELGMNMSNRPFRDHDRKHAQSFIEDFNKLQSSGQDIPSLILQSGQYFDQVVVRMAKLKKLDVYHRELLFYLYFYISHERNIPITSSRQWLYHVVREFVDLRISDEELLNKINHGELRSVFPAYAANLVDGSAKKNGWNLREITYEDIIQVLKTIWLIR